MAADALNLSPLSRFRSSVVAYIGSVIEELPKGDPARQVVAEAHKDRSAALGAFRDHIAALPKDDPRLFQLSLASRYGVGARPWGDREPFEPTAGQERILLAQGRWSGRPVGHERVFLDLISAGLRDVLAEYHQRHGKMAAAVEEAEAAREAAEARVATLTEAEADAARLRAELDAARAELGELTATCETLRGFLAAEGRGRRSKAIEGEPGIRETLHAGRLGLEVVFRDDQGKQRRQDLPAGSSLEDARALRKRLDGKPYQPPAADDDTATASEASQGDRHPRGRGGRTVGDQQPEPVAAGEGA